MGYADLSTSVTFVSVFLLVMDDQGGVELGAGRMGGNTGTKSGAPGEGPAGSATSMQSIHLRRHWVVVQEHWDARKRGMTMGMWFFIRPKGE